MFFQAWLTLSVVVCYCHYLRELRQDLSRTADAVAHTMLVLMVRECNTGRRRWSGAICVSLSKTSVGLFGDKVRTNIIYIWG